MAKENKKSPAQKAAEEAAAQQEAQVQNPQNNEEPSFAKALNLAKDKSLTVGEKVVFANLIHEAWVKDPKYAAIVDGASILRDALMGDVIVTQIVNGVDTFALIVRKDENRYLAIKNMLAAQGITLPDLKALPAPTEEQLKEAGVNLLPAETAVVTVKSEDVSEEAKKQKKAEKKIEDMKPSTNPAEIENEEQLAHSLSYLLTSGADKLDNRIQRVINFYRGYLTIQANKAENKEEALKQAKDKSRTQMLEEVAKIVGPCPFAFRGAAHMLLTRLQSTKSIVVPFCLYRRTANDSSNKNPLEDTFIADIVRILITWSCDSEISNANRTIAEMERLIRKNEDIVNTSKVAADVKIAKSAIKNYNDTIEKQKNNIKNYEELAGLVINPTFDMVDAIVADYDKEADSDESKASHMLVDTIMKTYYKDLDKEKLDKATMLNNTQQRAGVIVNMFRDPLSQSISYTEANIVEMKEAEAPAEEEKSEESKN